MVMVVMRYVQEVVLGKTGLKSALRAPTDSKLEKYFVWDISLLKNLYSLDGEEKL